jgi:hypothetical protein
MPNPVLDDYFFVICSIALDNDPPQGQGCHSGRKKFGEFSDVL